MTTITRIGLSWARCVLMDRGKKCSNLKLHDNDGFGGHGCAEHQGSGTLCCQPRPGEIQRVRMCNPAILLRYLTFSLLSCITPQMNEILERTDSQVQKLTDKMRVVEQKVVRLSGF